MSATSENLPTSVLTHIVKENDKDTTFITVQTTDKASKIIEQDTVPITTTGTIDSIMNEIQSQDKASFDPIDPQIMNMAKALSFIKAQKLVDGEVKLDITAGNDNVDQVVHAVRNEFPIIDSATVIGATETKVSTSVSNYKLYFFSPQPDKTYVIYQAVIQVNTENPGQSYTVTSLTEILKNGIPTNVVLQNTTPEQAENTINAAYGY